MSIKRKTVFGRKLPDITITDLRIGQITGTSFELFFTHPNANVTSFEVWIDGVLFDTIDGSGDYVVMLNPATLYSIQVKAVTTDAGTIESNIINETTLSAPYMTAKGLMALYKLDENTGLSGDQISNHCFNAIHGVTKGTYLSQTGKLGNAYEFINGQNLIVIRDNDIFSWTEKGINTPFSIGFWFYAYTTVDNYFISKRNVNTGEAEWQMGWISGELRCGIFGGNINNLLSVNTSVNIGINEWHHVVLSYDGLKTNRSLKTYLDGRFINDQGTFTGNWVGAVKTNADVAMGTDFQPVSSSKFEGLLDQVSFYRHRQLTRGEVSDIFNHGTGVDVIDPTSGSVDAITDLNIKSAHLNQIFLDFTRPNTNGSAVMYYDVYVDGVFNSLNVGSERVKAENLQGLTNYQIYVIARDAYGFQSPMSNTITASTTDNPIAPSNGLIAWFDMNDNTSFVDLVNNYTLQHYAPIDLVVGKVNNGCQFRGGSLQANNGSLFDRMSFTDGTKDLPFSIAFWCNPQSLGGTNPIFIEKLSVSPTIQIEWILFYNNNAGHNAIRLQLRDGNGNQINVIDGTSDRLTIDQWFHFSFTYDGSETKEGVKFYINGVNVAVIYDLVGIYEGIVKTTANFTVAGRHNGGNNLLATLDELAIYERELNSNEVNTLYNEGQGLTLTT